MVKLLPLSMLVAFFSFFGISWIVVGVDPDIAEWYKFALLIFLIFLFLFSTLGLLLYFGRTRFIKKYNSNWYVATSFKMAFFIALFVAFAAVLAILDLVNTFNIGLVIIALSLFAVYNYLGKKK